MLGSTFPPMYLRETGQHYLRAEKEPLLKGIRHVLLEHVPSGKITVGLNLPSSSTAFIRSVIIFKVFSRAQGEPPLGTNMHCNVLATKPTNGQDFMKSPPTNATFPCVAATIAGPSNAEQCGTKQEGTLPLGFLYQLMQSFPR